MPQDLAQLRVDGLTPLQVAELRAAVATAGSEYITTLDNPSLGGGKVGEPTLLTVVVTLGPSVISAIALWLAKQRKGRTKTITYKRIDPNGAAVSFRIDESVYSEGGSPREAIRTFLEKELGQ